MAGKGQPKTGGRQKGTPNRAPGRMRESIESILVAYIEDGVMAGDLMAIPDPEKRVGAALRMMDFVIPRLQRIDLKENTQRRARIEDVIAALYKDNKSTQ